MNYLCNDLIYWKMNKFQIIRQILRFTFICSCTDGFPESVAESYTVDCGVLLNEWFKESLDEGFDVLYRGVLLLVSCNISFDVLVVRCVVLTCESRDEGFKEDGMLCVWVEYCVLVVFFCNPVHVRFFKQIPESGR
jgi:hypothetical protein